MPTSELESARVQRAAENWHIWSISQLGRIVDFVELRAEAQTNTLSGARLNGADAILAFCAYVRLNEVKL